MLRSRALASFSAFLLPAAISVAQMPTKPSEPVYVTVAFNTAVLQTAEAQHVFSDLRTKFAPRQTHLQQFSAQVNALKKQLNENAASLSEAERSAKIQTLDADERQLQREADDFKGDTDSASQQAFQTVAQKLYGFLQDYAKQHAYALVIDRGSEAAPVVWYAAANADITVELIKAYDVKTAASSTDSHNHTNPHLPSVPTPHR